MKHDGKQRAAVVERVKGKLTDARYAMKADVSCLAVFATCSMIAWALKIWQIIQSIGKENPDDSEKRLGTLDIIKLCQNILENGQGIELSVSLKLCSRVAFLVSFVYYKFFVLLISLQCHVYTKNIAKRSSKYWNVVDTELVKICEINKDDKHKIHKYVYQASVSLSLLMSIQGFQEDPWQGSKHLWLSSYGRAARWQNWAPFKSRWWSVVLWWPEDYT